MIGLIGKKMSDSKVFNKSVIGSKHIASGKPCQDHSISLEKDGIQIVVVCDGHGGNSYFRSDRGAKFAAEITVDCLMNFVRCFTQSPFDGISFSITAKPQHNPFVDVDGNRIRFENLDETQKQFAKQAQSYIESKDKYIDQQKIVSELINKIFETWQRRIEEDVRTDPFYKEDRKALKDYDIYKAYGCTLLAFVKTPKYWLAIQIGDGCIYCCNKKLLWEKPVPNDCNCFLNLTTSLCDTNALFEFRYAFNGKGEMPMAVILCSDGLDGSLRTQDNLQDFYEQIIGLYIDGDNVENELNEYLPKLSENGNHDDISIAGIVDLDMYFPKIILCKNSKLICT